MNIQQKLVNEFQMPIAIRIDLASSKYTLINIYTVSFTMKDVCIYLVNVKYIFTMLINCRFI